MWIHPTLYLAVEAAGGVTVYRTFPFVAPEYCLNAAAHESIITDHVHHFMNTVYRSSYQQDKAPYH